MAVAIFIKFPNGITAETEQKGHEGSVAAESVQWGVGRGISTSVGKAARETSTPTFSEVVFTKTFDSSSNDLAWAAMVGKAMDEVVITFRKDDGGEQIDYLTYTLSDVLISGYSVSSGGGTPMESISLNFTKIASKYKALGKDHAAGNEHEFEYDLRAQA
jgi:type VI secretion system secreted protein Hcp